MTNNNNVILMRSMYKIDKKGGGARNRSLGNYPSFTRYKVNNHEFKIPNRIENLPEKKVQKAALIQDALEASSHSVARVLSPMSESFLKITLTDQNL